MTRLMVITVQCDGRRCDEEMEVNLEDGSPFEDYDTKIEKAFENAGWYINMDGDYCKKCSDCAKKEWATK
jgi:hypothetical protein